MEADDFRACLPTARVIGQAFGRRIPPTVRPSFDASARRALPFSFGREAIFPAGDSAQPVAKGHCIEPRRAHNRLPQLLKIVIVPEGRGVPLRFEKKLSVLGPSDLINS